MPLPKRCQTLLYNCALVLLLCLMAHPGYGASKRLALEGSPDDEAGLYVIGPASRLTRVYRERTSWVCRAVPLWAGPLVETSLVSGEQGVYGFTQKGELFTTYLDHGLARFGLLGQRTDIVPGSQVLGGTSKSNSGLYAVTKDGKLVRSWWMADRWRFETIPSWGGKIVAGSLISGEMRVIGVTSEGRMFNTYLDGGIVKFGLLGDRTDVVAGSLALGGEALYDANSGIYAVTTGGELIRGWWANNAWHFETIPSWGGKIVAGSLVSGEMRVYGTTDTGRVFNTYPAGNQIGFGILRDDVTVLPSSLALGGSPRNSKAVYAVDPSFRLLRFWWHGSQWAVEPVAGVATMAGSIVSAHHGVFGLDLSGRIFKVSSEGAHYELSFPCPPSSPTLGRQLELADVLRSFGIDGLDGLGTLKLSGNVAPRPGLTRPRPDLFGGTVEFEAATRAVLGAGGKRRFVPFAGTARLLNAIPFPGPGKGPGKTDIPIDTAYWAATWIDIPDGTNIVLQDSTRYLVILAEKLTVGKNVTFTYERRVEPPPAQAPKPGKPGKPPVPAPFSKGNTGYGGSSGSSGGQGWGSTDVPAPEVEMWVLSLEGSPAFDLRGQDGGEGGEGGAGGDGGDGSAGSPSKGNIVTCKYGPGDGGDGGPGGRAGDGGTGGDGGPGGRFTFNAPGSVIIKFTAGFHIETGGGAAGPGGSAGSPGAGGAGGPVGTINGKACRKPASQRTAGKPGPQGLPGKKGPAGKPGTAQLPDPVRMNPIEPAEFVQAWEKPAIQSVTSKIPEGRAYEGDTVSAEGLRFTPGDALLVTCEDGQAVPAATKVLSDTLLSFQVPSVPGGACSIQVEQPDGTLSNKASLFVLPRLASTQPGPRIRPGTCIQLIGTGFSRKTRALIANQDGGTVKYIDPHTLELCVVRPKTGVPANPGGETVSLGVALGDGTKSNEIQVILDTYQIVVFGDSVVWGTGLQDQEKFHTLVEQKVRQQLTAAGNPGVYRAVKAHTGAKIGLSLSPNGKPGLPAIPGEIPTRYPTISEQVEAFRGSPGAAYIDLVLVDGCANDVDMNTWMDPQRSTDQNRPLIEQACHDDMLELLEDIWEIFPAAKVVVTGYYPPLGPKSEGVRLMAFLIAIDSKWFNIPQHVVNGVLKPGTRDRVIENCQFFANTSNEQLALAVQDANSQLSPGVPRFFFANPKFTPLNAAMSGPASWIFGINKDLSPEDNMAAVRENQCKAHKNRTDLALCKRASAGHPNPLGARKYAEAIYPFLP
jgi:hypothetical protein